VFRVKHFKPKKSAQSVSRETYKTDKKEKM